jgi:formylmethanofuran dehydrogenase subunit E
MVDDKLHMICKKCGELRPVQAFKANFKARICNKCFEPPAEVTTDLVKHVQGLYEKKKPANRR